MSTINAILDGWVGDHATRRDYEGAEYTDGSGWVQLRVRGEVVAEERYERGGGADAARRAIAAATGTD